MFHLIRKSDTTIRKIADNKTALNYITKDISPNISLAIIEANDFIGEVTAEHSRIYYVLEGTLTLEGDGMRIILEKEDACFIEKGTTYTMSGTFKAIVVNSPAFRTPS